MIIIYESIKTKTFFALLLLLGFLNSRAQTYCSTSYYYGTWSGDYISLVKIPTTTLNSVSAGAFSAYKLFPASGSTTATLIRGNNYTLNVAGGTTGNCYITAWADWNKNGVFEATESIGISPNAGNSTTVSFANGITVPQWAAIGTTRIRFRSSVSNNPDLINYPCNSNLSNDGETEDYTISIACQFNTPPTAGFTYADTIFTKSPAILLNTNTYYLESNKWFINNVYDTNSTNLKHVFQNSGTYAICLKSTNCFGSDSNCFSVTVYNPTQKPVAAFSSNHDTIAAYKPVSFTDLSVKGPSYWNWTVTPATVNYLNGTSSTSQNPVIGFTNAGFYQVCLWDSNAIGRSSTVCKTIYVLPNNSLCIYPFDASLSSGCLVDEGGIAGNYSSGGTCSFLIDACASSVNLKFSQFNLTSNSFLRIYDGTYNTSPPLFTSSGFSGTSLPGGTSGITAMSGKMYIEFQKGATAPGFTANWTTTPSTSLPPSGTIDDLDSADDCGGFYRYAYVSKDPNFDYAAAVYSWDLDYIPNNGPAIEQKGYYYTDWSYGTPGTYVVRLKIQNCGGVEIIYDTVVVFHPTSGPNTKFKIEPSTALTGDTITLTDDTKIPAYWRQWSISGTGGYSVISGNTSSKIFKIKLNTTAPYQIQLMDSNCAASTIARKNISTYCKPVVTNLIADFSLKRFELNNINKLTFDSTNILNYSNSTPAVGTTTYRDNTKAVEAIAKLGDSLSFKLERNTAISPADFKIWIDYNQDGVFQNSELVASSASISGNYFVGSFVIPLNAKTNYTRIRIGTNAAGFSNTPCGVNTFGDFNDYLLKLYPAIYFPNNNDTVFVEVGRPFTDPGIQVFGASGITHTGKAFGSVVTAYPSLAVHTISASDSNENITVRNIFVKATKDTTRPVISLIGADTIYVEAGTTYTDPGATANDFYFGSLTASLLKYLNVNTSSLGFYYVSYKVSDAAGNTADSVVRRVIVRDTKAPIITLNGKDTIIINVKTLGVVPEPGYSYGDNFYHISTLILKVDYGNVNLNKIGKYPVRYYISDPSGNMDSSKVRVYNVKDTSAPVITLLGNFPLINWPRWKAYVDPGNFVTDNYDTNLVCVPDISGVNYLLPGLYVVKFNVSDSTGNKAKEVVRYVNVWYEGIDVNTTTSLFKIYPNPNHGLIEINFGTKTEVVNGVYIFDSQGSLVFTKENPNFINNNMKVDLRNLASGLYLIKIVAGASVETKVISVQH